MPVDFTLPPDTRAVGTGNPPQDTDNIVDALTAIGAGRNILNGAYAGGADPAGAADSAPAIQAALNAAPAGSAVIVPPGDYKAGSQISIPAGVWLVALQSGGYRAIPYASARIFASSSFAGASLITFAAGTPAGGIMNLALDGSSLPAGSVDGVGCYTGCKQGSLTGLNINAFTGHGININNSAGTGNPDGWYLHEISAHNCGGDGVHWDYCVDAQFDIGHLDHNTGSGLTLGTLNNCSFSNIKAQQNTSYGYALTGGFVKSNSAFSACMSENNSLDGWHLNVTTGGGQGPLTLLGCSARDDGVSGVSGSGFSGFWLNGKNCDITLAGCSSYVTASTAGPDYGLQLAGCLGNVAVIGGSYGGSVAAYHDGGGNTGTIAFDRVTEWTGQAGTRSGVTMVTTAAAGNAAPASFTPANPASTTSATAVMMGLGGTCKYTPAASGRLLVTVAGTQGISAGAAAAVTIGGRYGTGTAPAGGTASAGTAFGWSADVSFGKNSAVGSYEGFGVTAVISGLTTGTQYWLDLALASDGTNTAQLRGVTMSVAEL